MNGTGARTQIRETIQWSLKQICAAEKQNGDKNHGRKDFGDKNIFVLYETKKPFCSKVFCEKNKYYAKKCVEAIRVFTTTETGVFPYTSGFSSCL